MLDLKYLDAVIGSFAVFSVYRLMTLEKRALPLPPGPRGWPIIGNLLDVPPKEEWFTFAKWGDTYGKIASVTGVLSIIVLNELETHRFLKQLLSRPAEFSDHIRKTAGAIILRISHGYEVGEGQDPFVTLADKHNTFPYRPQSTQYLPDWFPGASFKKTAKEWSSTLKEMVDLPYDYVKKQIVSGTAEPSYVSKLVEGQSLTAEQEFEIKWSSASLYSVSDFCLSHSVVQTVSAIYSFFKAMSLYPEVQAKAQAELDAVIGNDCLPSFENRDHLPYMQAVTLETLRWFSVVPTSVPHRVTEDNVFKGYFIPKGALVLSNLWQMNHDPEVYHDPMSFKPERFLGPKPELDPREACFGFARR
ncbi:cytochrome P450 [Lentinula detonsa]|uniref:Cytochrome P450 n=1 Tax=Lentinula detonsa TaxID=2804962 RepID=A0A9W8PCR5_9AGAR|nr:cytochrome P450 [Lentinula detonsa]